MLKTLSNCACILALPAALALPAEGGRRDLDPFFQNFMNLTCADDQATLFKKASGDFVLRVMLPGFEKKDIKIIAQNGVLQITAKTKETLPENTEVVFGNAPGERAFQETYKLGDEVNLKSLKATLKDGVLEISMTSNPKKAEAQTITIE